MDEKIENGLVVPNNNQLQTGIFGGEQKVSKPMHSHSLDSHQVPF